MADQTVKVILQGEDKTGAAFKSASKSAGALGKDVSFLSKDVSGLAKGLAGATVAVGALAVAFGVSAVKSAIESQKALAQLGAVLKSTGEAAGLSAKEITDHATALQKMTTFSDEAIIGGQNLLLTFTQIKGPIFKDATAAILDISTAMGQDLKSSAIQVGKALNDPIEGLSSLTRIGVRFTETQKEQITTLVESGRVMEAQKIILSELATEFGGSAAAAAGTFEGKLLQVNNQVDDLKEIIGGALIEAITPFITELTVWASNPDVQKKITEIAQVVGEFAREALPIVIETIRIWYQVFKGIVDIISDVIVGVNNAVDAIQRFSDAVKNSAIGKGVSSITTGISNVVKTITGKRAAGGPVSMGGTYLVGEKGPELFRPSSSGSIIPNGAGGGAITINISGNTLLDGFAGEKIGKQIMDTLKANLRI